MMILILLLIIMFILVNFGPETYKFPCLSNSSVSFSLPLLLTHNMKQGTNTHNQQYFNINIIY